MTTIFNFLISLSFNISKKINSKNEGIVFFEIFKNEVILKCFFEKLLQNGSKC